MSDATVSQVVANYLLSRTVGAPSLPAYGLPICNITVANVGQVTGLAGRAGRTVQLAARLLF